MKTLKQKELAERVGISDAMISQILTGKKRPSWTTAKKLAKETGTKPELWLDGKPGEIKIVLENIA